MRNLFFLLLMSVVLFACNSAGTSEQGDGQEQTQEEGDKKYTLTPFTPSKAYPNARLEAMAYQDGKFAFTVSGDEYELGAQTSDAGQKMCANSAKGQHIHVIVDNSPYMAKYQPEFDYEMPEGEHYILSFLSRSYHESIKLPAAKIAQKVTVEGGKFAERSAIEAPMLFYSRPKGNYVGANDTKKVMLDFYLLNAELGENYQVEADINGEKHLIDKWQPYYIEGMPMGENSIKLTLLDKDGKVVDTPLNPVQRTFSLQEDPAEQ